MAKYGKFDITEKTIDYVYNNIVGMAGNPGQEVLIEMLKEQMANGQCILEAEVGEDTFSATGTMYLDFSSPHEEAINEIIEMAIQHGELFAKQAEIPGPYDFEEAVATGNWKIVGYDQ